MKQIVVWNVCGIALLFLGDYFLREGVLPVNLLRLESVARVPGDLLFSFVACAVCWILAGLCYLQSLKWLVDDLKKMLARMNRVNEQS